MASQGTTDSTFGWIVVAMGRPPSRLKPPRHANGMRKGDGAGIPLELWCPLACPVIIPYSSHLCAKSLSKGWGGSWCFHVQIEETFGEILVSAATRTQDFTRKLKKNSSVSIKTQEKLKLHRIATFAISWNLAFRVVFEFFLNNSSCSWVCCWKLEFFQVFLFFVVCLLGVTKLDLQLDLQTLLGIVA